MPRFEDELLGLIPQTDWLNVGTTVTRPNDPIDGLLTDTKTENLVAEWEYIASQFQIPMMAHFHGFDTEANTTFRVPIDSQNIEKGLIKVKLNQSERFRALKLKGVTNNNALYDYVLNDGIRLADQVATRSKVAKNELLATGKVTIKENNLDLTVDYGVPAAHTAFTLDLAPTADIADQIQSIIDVAESAGVTITGMLTSKQNITKMRRNAGLQKEINGNVGVGAIIRSTALSEYLNEEFGISQIVTQDLTYGASATIDADTQRPTISTRRYYPTDKITFFARVNGAALGTGLWGNPPEVDTNPTLNAKASDLPYIILTQWAEKDPAVTWMKASALFMPVLYNPNSLFVATVSDSSGN